MSINNIMFVPEDVLGILVVISLTWMFSVTIRKKIATKRIKSLLKKNNLIKGHKVGYWLKDVEYPVEYAFDTSESNVILFENIDFFFVEATVTVITFNQIKSGIGMSHYKCWCVLAVGTDAIEILKNNRSLFKKISIDQNNEIGLFSIRKLFSFASLLRRESQRRVGEEQ